MGKISKISKRIVISSISCYQYLFSPILGRYCRFLPTCSSYAKEAIDSFGVFKGGILALKRIFCCHPWGKSGYDPVPKKSIKYQR